MSNKNFNSNIFDYSINNQTYLNIDNLIPLIYSILSRWEKIISNIHSSKIKINIIIDYISNINTLGSTRIVNINSNIFGETIPTHGEIIMNAYHVEQFDYNKIYYTFLHEFGHLMGIGSLWYIYNSPINKYIEDGIEKKYYMGKNAVREYKRYFNNSNLIGIPVEDDGAEGTVDVHPEEGDLVSSNLEISKNDRYLNGIFHPGLDNELMTGWLNNKPSMSRITIGFLEDLGYTVNYEQADYYNPLNINLPEFTIKNYLPDNTIYDIDDFLDIINLKNIKYKNEKIKILIIDSGFNKQRISQLGTRINNTNYKNFINNNSFLINDKLGGTNVFETINTFIKTEFYFAESEWIHSETIDEVDYMIEALKWAKQIKPDIVNISVGYSFDDFIIHAKKDIIKELISDMSSTIFCSGVRKIKSTKIELPSSINLPNLITIGNSQGYHDFNNNFKPDFVLPNLSNINNNIIWNKLQTTNKCTSIFTGLVAISMTERNISAVEAVKLLINNTSKKRSPIYGYGYPDMKYMTLDNTDIIINPGWNLVSFPYESINIKNITDNYEIEEVKDINYSYNKNISNLNFNSLKSIKIDTAYWIKSNKLLSINVSGFMIKRKVIELQKGWNMISCPLNRAVHINEFINDSILEIKSTLKSYNILIKDLSLLDTLEPNVGYYIRCSKNTSIKFED